MVTVNKINNILSITSIVFALLSTFSGLISTNSPNLIVYPPWITPYEMTFPLSTDSESYSVGKVVSMNKEGNLQLGGGFTLFKDVYVNHNIQARYLRVAYIGKNILVSAYNSYIQVFLLNDDLTVRKTKDSSLPSGRNPDDLITIHDNVLLLLGNNAVLPITVEVDLYDNIKVHYGKEAKYYDQFNFESSFTRLNDDYVAVSYRGISNHLTIVIVGITYNVGYIANIITKKEYTGADEFKGISYFSESKFLVAYTLQSNSTLPSNTLYFQIGTFSMDTKELSFSSRISYINPGQYNVFEFTRMKENTLLVVYLNTYTNTNNPTATSLLSTLIFYNPKEDTITFSNTYPIYKYRDGGIDDAENYYKHLSIEMLSSTTFGVFYSNSLLGESMCFIYVHITPLNTILPSTEQYILSSSTSDPSNTIFWSSIYKVSNSRFYLIYSLTTNQKPAFAIHIGEFLSTPLGVITSVKDNQVTFMTSGVAHFSNTTSFKVGKYYYTDSLGNLIEGEYVGTSDIDGIYTYIQNGRELMSKTNRIGFAVDEHSIFIQKNSDATIL